MLSCLLFVAYLSPVAKCRESSVLAPPYLSSASSLILYSLNILSLDAV